MMLAMTRFLRSFELRSRRFQLQQRRTDVRRAVSAAGEVLPHDVGLDTPIPFAGFPVAEVAIAELVAEEIDHADLRVAFRSAGVRHG